MSDIGTALEVCFEYKYSKKEKNNNYPPNMISLLEQVVCDGFSKPYVVYIEVTSRCNLRCKHCLFGNNEANYLPGKDLSTEEILSVLNNCINEFNIIMVNITGKEPFLNKDIFKIIDFVKANNLYLKLQTNGTLLTDSMIKKLSLLLNNNDIVQVSLDGASEFTNDEIRGKGNFIKTSNSIKKLRQHGINVILAYTINRKNTSDIEDLYDLSKKLGICLIVLGLYVDFEVQKDELIPNSEEILLQCEKLIKKINKNGDLNVDLAFLTIPFVLQFDSGKKLLDNLLQKTDNIQKQSIKCHKCERLTIMADGEAYLCQRCITKDKKFSLGNVKTDSIDFIWNNSKKNVFYQGKDLKKSICAKCNYLSICKGGCLASSYFRSNSIDAPPLDCTYFKTLEKKYGKEFDFKIK